MQIRLAAPLQSDSIVDGYGIRTVIWTQGCLHNCPFCHNPGTHELEGGALFDLEEIEEKISSLKKQDGITFSGGDPMYQVEACAELAEFCQSINLNVWCYSGFTYEEILELSKKNKAYMKFLKNIDVLVDGRFEIAKKSYDVLFRGSTNQRLINMKETLKTKKVVLMPEEDNILEKYKQKSGIYI